VFIRPAVGAGGDLVSVGVGSATVQFTADAVWDDLQGHDVKVLNWILPDWTWRYMYAQYRTQNLTLEQFDAA
jgi:hypothetical protein